MIIQSSREGISTAFVQRYTWLAKYAYTALLHITVLIGSGLWYNNHPGC
jgi:hypothetical protein